METLALVSMNVVESIIPLPSASLLSDNKDSCGSLDCDQSYIGNYGCYAIEICCAI